MPNTTSTPDPHSTPDPMPNATGTSEARTDSGSRSHFTKAMEEAKAGAQAFGREAVEKAEAYREKLNRAGDDLAGQARVKSGEAKGRAQELASEGKSKASKAMSNLGKLVEEQAETIDGAVGGNYGDYARRAGQSIQGTAAKLDEKSIEELGEDAMEFVRRSPALAVGMAAAAGFVLARLVSRK